MLAPCLADRAVVVHGQAHARTALAVGRTVGRAVTLLSPAGAGCFAGAGWWRGLVAAASAACPAAEMHDILDCGDAPGAAMAALRAGQHCLVLLPCPSLAAVRGAAGTLGAVVLDARPPALDLAAPYAALALSEWLDERLAGGRAGDMPGLVG